VEEKHGMDLHITQLNEKCALLQHELQNRENEFIMQIKRIEDLKGSLDETTKQLHGIQEKN
jgi:hypothetical protein